MINGKNMYDLQYNIILTLKFHTTLYYVRILINIFFLFIFIKCIMQSVTVLKLN